MRTHPAYSTGSPSRCLTLPTPRSRRGSTPSGGFSPSSDACRRRRAGQPRRWCPLNEPSGDGSAASAWRRLRPRSNPCRSPTTDSSAITRVAKSDWSEQPGVEEDLVAPPRGTSNGGRTFQVCVDCQHHWQHSLGRYPALGLLEIEPGLAALVDRCKSKYLSSICWDGSGRVGSELAMPVKPAISAYLEVAPCRFLPNQSGASPGRRS
jgi:hypothetical protein